MTTIYIGSEMHRLATASERYAASLKSVILGRIVVIVSMAAALLIERLWPLVVGVVGAKALSLILVLARGQTVGMWIQGIKAVYDRVSGTVVVRARRALLTPAREPSRRSISGTAHRRGGAFRMVEGPEGAWRFRVTPPRWRSRPRGCSWRANTPRCEAWQRSALRAQ